MVWAIVDIQHRRNIYFLPRTQPKTIIKEMPVMQTVGKGLTDKSISDLAVAIENLSATLKHQDQVILGAEALQNKSLDIINRLLDERLQTKEITAVSVPIETGGTVEKSLDERIRVYYVKHPGTSVRNVAKALKCSPSKVQRWKEKQNSKGGK